MNRFSYHQTDENGLSFVLEIDGAPLADALGSPFRAIGYQIVLRDLPCDPPLEQPDDTPLRIVGTCSCGELACGYTRCQVTRSRKIVTLSHFDTVGGAPCESPAFRFPEADFDSVVAEIVELAHRRRARARLL